MTTSLNSKNNNGAGRVAMKTTTSLLSNLDLPKVKKAEKWGEVNNFRNKTPRDKRNKKKGKLGLGRTTKSGRSNNNNGGGEGWAGRTAGTKRQLMQHTAYPHN